MKPFKTHRGTVATLDRANVDTDQIIPKQFLKSVKRTGFGEALFYDWRYLSDGKPDPAFALNRPEFKNASILVARNNFGCGSSREHAVWAIAQYGFRAVIAPRVDKKDASIPAFADIFRGNCVKNAVLTVELSESEVETIFVQTKNSPKLEATIDLDKQRLTLHVKDEISFEFPVDAAVKQRLLQGLDDISLTLKHEDEITRFEATHDTQLNPA